MITSPFAAVVIGASAGALDALSHILPLLPAEFALPILIVVHVPPDKKGLMVELFQAKCAMRVVEAEDKVPLETGTVYFSPPDYHMLVEHDHRLSLSMEAPVLFSRPSIDVLFESAADAYGSALIGIILTGANEDGAKGLQAIVKAGGVALVQRPDLAYASAMPQAALQACPSAQCYRLAQITDYLQKVTA